jgi:pimeloyl-ACP methyl ester carboxylesterase
MYQAQRQPHSDFVPVRTLRYHVLRWGDAATATRPPLVLLHGWMDVAASWQFMVDALDADFVQGRCILAPDWRGFGLSISAQDNYWFPDYLADLDALLRHYAGEQTVDLVGHSMGGNVAMLYAGVRPRRIRRLVNLEGFGLPANRPEQAPQRYAQWLDEIAQLHRGELALKTYADAEGVTQRLMKTNPRLPLEKAQWLARQWARPHAQGQWEILGAAAHKIVNAQLYRVDEVLACWAQISAPVLVVESSEPQLDAWWQGRYTLAEFHQRLQRVPQVRRAVIDDAGHMLHHDQPERLAALLAGFLG